jgi:hypothetical protein
VDRSSTGDLRAAELLTAISRAATTARPDAFFEEIAQ